MRRHVDTILPRPQQLTALARRFEGWTAERRIVVHPDTAKLIGRALEVYADLMSVPRATGIPFTVDVWSDNGGLAETLASSQHGLIARAAFQEACQHRKTHRVTLRQGAHIIAENRPG